MTAQRRSGFVGPRGDRVTGTFRAARANVRVSNYARDAAAPKLLLVAEDAQTRILLRELLASQRYEVLAAASVPPFARARRWDAAILDAAAASGAAHRLGDAGAERVPTLLIAARNAAAPERLWARVDAVLHEPFDARKLLLVVRGLLAGRRPAAARAGGALAAGPLSLDAALNTATVGGREIALTDAETRVLRELVLAAGRTVPRERLMRLGLGREWSPGDRALDTHIKRLRRKLGAERRGRSPIRTVRGVGYRLVTEWR